MRKGNQTPTQAYILPYEKSYGKDAIKLYNSTGRTAQEWQETMLEEILAINEEELFVHIDFGYSVPRRNGKNEIVSIREMWGLMNGERILHTAHRTSTSHVAWERLLDLLGKAGVKIVSSYRASGKEHIKTENGTIEFRTRTSKGGLGEGFDLLVIDEAQEYQDDQESALKYVVSDSKNPQTLYCGTPPTPQSSGTVFTKFRSDVLAGEKQDSGWAEWSVETKSDPNDIEKWYLTNPSLGTILTERKIRREIGPDVMDFNIQRLGLWATYALKSTFSQTDWDKLKIKEKPEFLKSLFVGIKYGNDGTNVAMSVAVKTVEGKTYIEGVDCRSMRSGNNWIVEFLIQARPTRIVIDGASGQNVLAEELQEEGIKKAILPTVKEIVTANSLFENAVFNEGICHNNQPSMTMIATNCDHRNIGTSGGFGYKSLKPENDIALLDSAVLAFWACASYKERRKQKITY